MLHRFTHFNWKNVFKLVGISHKLIHLIQSFSNNYFYSIFSIGYLINLPLNQYHATKNILWHA